MAKYKVMYEHIINYVVEVYADSEDEADKLAQNVLDTAIETNSLDNYFDSEDGFHVVDTQEIDATNYENKVATEGR